MHPMQHVAPRIRTYPHDKLCQSVSVCTACTCEQVLCVCVCSCVFVGADACVHIRYPDTRAYVRAYTYESEYGYTARGVRDARAHVCMLELDTRTWVYMRACLRSCAATRVCAQYASKR